MEEHGIKRIYIFVWRFDVALRGQRIPCFSVFFRGSYFRVFLCSSVAPISVFFVFFRGCYFRVFRGCYFRVFRWPILALCATIRFPTWAKNSTI